MLVTVVVIAVKVVVTVVEELVVVLGFANVWEAVEQSKLNTSKTSFP